MSAIKTTAIRAVTDDPDTHTVALKQLKETTELALRLRGDPRNSFVRVGELVDAGVVRISEDRVLPVTAITITGSRGANAALASLIAALVARGIIVDQTT